VYKKDGADTWIEYWPGTEQWQLKPGSNNKGKDSAYMLSLGAQKEVGVVEEVTAGWKVYDSNTKVWSEQAGVRVVRHAAAVQVSGTTGPNAAIINGVYRLVVGEGVGGKPVYKKDGADTWIEYWPGTMAAEGGKRQGDGCCLHAFTGRPEGVVEEVTAGWKVYDSTTKVCSEQAGVRVVRYMAGEVHQRVCFFTCEEVQQAMKLHGLEDHLISLLAIVSGEVLMWLGLKRKDLDDIGIKSIADQEKLKTPRPPPPPPVGTPR
jgi:hypothetical protein